MARRNRNGQVVGQFPDGSVSWVPDRPFTVDGIRYDYRDKRGCLAQPMITLKGGGGMSHIADAEQLNCCRHKWLEWSDVRWDPDIIF